MRTLARCALGPLLLLLPLFPQPPSSAVAVVAPRAAFEHVEEALTSFGPGTEFVVRLKPVSDAGLGARGSPTLGRAARRFPALVHTAGRRLPTPACAIRTQPRQPRPSHA
ncbi:hypothetical protein XA68_15611 [Ophiocordyceps unilateralis]|uniref:Uncharacterized protein n=1 Tax=Ophiocordyceps unilateralis TaxID=268505 RepID=A0A2A9P814_OPHUN|nr:hypothetical protein XA68_15611 [Ophiocordyceps unilateralis]